MVGGYYINSNEFGNFFYKINAKGDTILKSLIKISPTYQSALTAYGKYSIYLPSINEYLGYNALIDSGSIKLLRFSCDTMGKNPKVLYNKYPVKALDSMSITHPQVFVKYIPGKCFYVYGQSPYARNNSYIIWKLDTSGKMLWRQDYYDTFNSSNFTLTEFKNKLLYTSTYIGAKDSGMRLVWMDTMGNVLSEKSLNGKYIAQHNEYLNGGSLWGSAGFAIMPDTSIIMGFSCTNPYGIAWPAVIKFKPNLDTAWTKVLKIARDAKKIDPTNDYTQIEKIVISPDSAVAVWWYKSFVDYNWTGTGGYQYGSVYALSRIDASGHILPSVHPDSVDWWFHEPGGLQANDMIATSDNGFAFAGQTYNYTNSKYNTYLLKLSNSIVMGVQQEEAPAKDGISVYPNPARDKVIIQNEKPFESATMNLYNIQGQLAKSYTNFNGISLSIERNSLPSGLYLLKIQTAKGEQFLKKIIFE